MPKLARPTGRGKKKPGKMAPLNMRTTEEIRRRMEETAAASGRSLAQEVEYRLSQSFERDEFLRLLFGRPYFADIFQKMAEVARRIERKTGKTEAKDIATMRAIQAAWVVTVSQLSPHPHMPAAEMVAAIRAAANVPAYVPAYEEEPLGPEFDAVAKDHGEIVRQIFEEDWAKQGERIEELNRRWAHEAKMRSIQDKIDPPQED
jgi:hypothetical protein